MAAASVAGAADPAQSSAHTMPRRPGLEPVAYAVLGLVLAIVLWTRVDDAGGFFLDEWIYVPGGQYMWEHFPSGLWGTIPEWTRGPQRLYSALIGIPWTTLSPWAAYRVSHALNIALLVSGIVPAALFARRIIASPPLRVLAVALAVVLPWFTISLHLLTENLAFPVFLWACYAGVVAADEPTAWRQISALLAIAVLALCRVNLVLMALGPALAVIVFEWRNRRDGWRAILRRRWPFAAGIALAALAALYLAVRGGSALGAYGGTTPGQALDRLFGDTARQTRTTIAFYARGLVVGGFVLPFALGSAAALAAAFGRLGPRLISAGLVAIGAGLGVVVAVSAYTTGAALEERYVFYAYAPLALFAVAAVEHAGRLRRWGAVGALIALWLIVVGPHAPADTSGHFFAAPAGAFWTRVMDFRLHHWEEQLLGWTLLAPTGWLLIALALAVTVGWLYATARRPAVRTIGLVAALAVCLVAQAAMLIYDLKQELYGTVVASGGIASPTRQDDIDTHIPGGSGGVVVPGVVSTNRPSADAEALEFWNPAVDRIISLEWLGLPTPAPPGFKVVFSNLGKDGLVVLGQPAPRTLLVQPDDPRVQFAGTITYDSPNSTYAVLRARPLDHAIWSASGLAGDGAIQQRQPVTMTLDRAHARDVRSVEVTLSRPAENPSTARVTVTGTGGKRVAAAAVRSGKSARLRLPVRPCSGGCAPQQWQLKVRAKPVGIPFPVYGAPGPPRPVVAFVNGVHLSR